MEQYEEKTVRVLEKATFKSVKVECEAIYQHCDLAEVLYMYKQQMQDNTVQLIDVYRKV